MAAVITINDGSGLTTSPALILGYETSRESQNIIHDLIGGGIAVALIRPRPRSGTLELFYLTEADAKSSLDLHSSEASFTLSEPDRPTWAMTYVASGALTVKLDEEGRRRWTVSVDYQEVDA